MLGTSGSLLRVEGEGVELSSLFVRKGATYARLWNASGAPRLASVQGDGKGELVTVGLRLEEGERLAGGDVSLRPWGLQTVRLSELGRT